MKMSVWSLACQQSVFQWYDSEKHLSEFYPQEGGESQLASKLRHCHPMYSVRAQKRFTASSNIVFCNVSAVAGLDAELDELSVDDVRQIAVSYTHLTLPTKRIV